GRYRQHIARQRSGADRTDRLHFQPADREPRQHENPSRGYPAHHRRDGCRRAGAQGRGQRMKTKRLATRDADFDQRLTQLTAWSEERDAEVGARVRDIIRAIRERGDAALIEFTNRFDRRDVRDISELVIGAEALQAALHRIPAAQRTALEAAAARVRDYHQRQKQESWQYRDADGTLLGQQVTPLDRAGLYVPGGKAAYPSSVLMNALPAKVAGVGEVVMVSPAPDGVVNDTVLAAAAVAGVDRVFTMGGAQAVAALAWGTATVPGVDKIVGPGN